MKQTKASKEQLLAQVDDLRKRNGLLEQAVNAICNGDSTYIGRKGPYSITLVSANRAHGGIVIVRFAPGGQRPDQQAHYFDEWYGWVRSNPMSGTDEEWAGLANLADQCYLARNRAVFQGAAA